MGFKTIEEVTNYFSKHGSNEIFFKFLSPNDNTKNQVYLGSNFGAIQIFKNLKLTVSPETSKKQIVKAPLDLHWISDDLKEQFLAPKAQLILYPQYPEVRMSGFLSGCENPPSELMNSRIPDRILIFGVNKEGRILATVLPPSSPLRPILSVLKESVLNQIVPPTQLGGKSKLLNELARIAKKGWINACRLDPSNELVPCNGSNCGGNTLEAMLGIKSNGRSEPDFFGWEVKQFSVSNFETIRGGPITLFTPEPDTGVYKEKGARNFLVTYGYKDKSGRNRINFSSPHKFNIKNPNTGLTLKLEGFDAKSKKILDVKGGIVLLDGKNKVTAKWDFKSLMEHWNTKHNLAVYVPGLKQVGTDDKIQYKFCSKVFLGEKTDFLLFLIACAESKIIYDPGMKLDLDTDRVKLRSQFRIKFGDAKSLYHNWTET